MQKIFIKILLCWLFFSTFVIALLNKGNQVGFAKIIMACGLVLFWVVICGGVMYKFRENFKAVFQKIPLGLGKKFFIFTVLLAMLEELIATAMTNTAPLFGLSLGQAYITASSNFWQVILHHSVIVFLPAFLAWTFLVKRYNFSANQAFWLFGITGTLMEALTFGPQKIF